MRAWTFRSIGNTFSNFLSEIWARITVNTSSLVFILLLLFLSPVQIFLQIWARQPTADAFNLLYAIDDISNLPLAFEVLVPGGPLLSCFEIPSAGASFEACCETVWDNVLAINDSSSFQAVETTVAAAAASTVFDNYIALARPTGSPSVLAGHDGGQQRTSRKGRFRSGFRGDRDRWGPRSGRFRFKGSKGRKGGKKNGTGNNNNQASVAASATTTSQTNQGMLLSSAIVRLPVETAVGLPNEPPVIIPPSQSSIDGSISTAFITIVLEGDSVVNVPTFQLTASALPIATGSDPISQSTAAALSASISTVADPSPLSTAVAVTTGGTGPQSLSQGKGRPNFGQSGNNWEQPTPSPTPASRPLQNPGGNNKGGSNRTGPNRASTGTGTGKGTGAGKGKDRPRPGTSQGGPKPKARPNTLFPAPKKGPLSVFKPQSKNKPFKKRQTQTQTSVGSAPDADGDDDGDGADDDDEDYGDQDPDYSSYVNTTFVIPFNGRNIELEPQFDQPSSNDSSSRRLRFIGMTLTGLHSAPFGSADVTFVATPCIRGLIWAEQTVGYTLKESAVAMALWAWIGGIGILAVLIQSMSLIITSFISLLIAVIFSVFQMVESHFFQREYQRAVVNGVCGGVDVIESYPNLRLELQFGMIGMAFVGMLLAGVCTRLLLQVFGAEMRNKLKGLPALNRPYRNMITLKVIFELLFFIIPVTSALWLDGVFSSLPAAFSEDNELEEALFSCFAGFVVPWLMLGYEATRRSLCRTMIIFLVFTLPILAGWSAFFVVDLYRVWLISWQFLAILPVIAITLTTVVLVVGIVYRLDFKRGLPQLMGQYLPKDGSAVFTTPSPDLERAVPAGETKADVSLPQKVQFDIPSSASAKSVEVSTNEGETRNNDIWTPKRARNAAPSAWHDCSSRWTPGRLKGLFSSSGSTATRDRPRPSRTSSTYGPGRPLSIVSYSGSGTPPPSSYLASIRNQPTSPHYTDSSVDLSERGTKRAPRRAPGAPPRPARPARLKLRDSLATEESSKESDAETAPAAKQVVRTGIGPSGDLRVAGRFALGLK